MVTIGGMKPTLALLAACLALSAAAPARAEKVDYDKLFRWEARAEPAEVAPGGRGEIVVTLTVAPDHHVYGDKTEVAAAPAPGLRWAPALRPAGKVKPDPLTGKDRELLVGAASFRLPYAVEADAEPGKRALSFEASYQGCSHKVCYFPQTKALGASLRVVKGAAAGTTSGASGPTAGDGEFGAALAKGFLAALAFAFVGGLLTSLTPCVYPMIPITVSVFGARAAESRAKAFLLSLTYVGGIAVMYSALGALAAGAGGLFGQALGSPPVIAFVVLVFAAMGLSMLGLFRMDLPPALQARLGRVGGRGYAGAFAMGLVGGVIAAPCTGPALAAILAYVAASGDPLRGGLLLFSFALGLGMLFLAIGTFSSLAARLPRSGPWMEGVKGVFGVVLLTVALYYLKDIVPALGDLLRRDADALLVAAALVASGLALGAVHRSFADPSAAARLRKGAGIVFTTLGLYLALGPLGAGGPGPKSAEARAALDWKHGEAEALAAGKRLGRPVMLDFYADWCAACREFDERVWPDPRVRERLAGFVNGRLDFTRMTPENERLLARYGVVGLPTILFFDSSGALVRDKTLTGFVGPEEFLKHAESVR